MGFSEQLVSRIHFDRARDHLSTGGTREEGRRRILPRLYFSKLKSCMPRVLVEAYLGEAVSWAVALELNVVKIIRGGNSGNYLYVPKY